MADEALTTIAPVDVFLIYASEDQALKEELQVHLAVFKRQGAIRLRHQGTIEPGEATARVLLQYMDDARVSLCLLSAHLIAADETYEILQQLLRRREEGETELMLIRARPAVVPESVKSLQLLPRGGEPIASRLDRDSAWVEIANEVGTAVERIRQNRLRKRLAEAEDAAAGAPEKPLASLDGARVLWVDDHPSNNLYEQRALAELRVEVSLCRSTKQALGALNTGPAFDLIISDWNRRKRPEGPRLVEVLPDKSIPVIFYIAPMTPRQRQSRINRIEELTKGGADVRVVTASLRELLDITEMTLRERTLRKQCEHG